MVSRFMTITLWTEKAGSTDCVYWYLDFWCKTYGPVIVLVFINGFVEKFNWYSVIWQDEIAAIIGYGDYKLGDTIISRVYYVEGLKHNLFSVGQFCDGGLEVAFRQHSCHIRNYDMVDLLKGSRTTNLYSISLNDMMSASPVCLLTKASSTKSWRKFDIGIFVGYCHPHHEGVNRIYNKRSSQDSGTFMLPVDELTDGLTSCSNKDDFVSIVDEDEAVPIPLVCSDNFGYVSAAGNQDYQWFTFHNSYLRWRGSCSLLKNSLPQQILYQTLVILMLKPRLIIVDVMCFDTHNAPETVSDSIHSNSVNIDVTPNNQLPHVQKWTQAHPLENIIEDKDRPVSTRKQLETDAMWCFFNEFLNSVEPRLTSKDLEALCWIEAMTGKNYEFVTSRLLDTWCPVQILFLSSTLKWISKLVMNMETLVKNKARLVGGMVIVRKLWSKLLKLHHHCYKQDLSDTKRNHSHGLWYPKDSGFELLSFCRCDYAGCHDTRRCYFLVQLHFLDFDLFSGHQKAEKYCHSTTRLITPLRSYQDVVLCLIFSGMRFSAMRLWICVQLYSDILLSKRFGNSTPTLGVKQMSPETLKELRMWSVLLEARNRHPNGGCRSKWNAMLLILCAKFEHDHRLHNFKKIAAIFLSRFSIGLVSIAHLDLCAILPHYTLRGD
ncbi:hypothetical protein Tco_1213576 [Tanacetum coccineum]